MGTKNNPGKFDCYANAEPDEPMFVLLGRDRHASVLVWLWAKLRELDGEGEEKVKEAENCAFAMVKWGADRNRKHVGLSKAAEVLVHELADSYYSVCVEAHKRAACALCGLPMNADETMFFYHGHTETCEQAKQRIENQPVAKPNETQETSNPQVQGDRPND